jgi:hypothetical protein
MSAQLIVAALLFAGFAAVWLIGRRRPAGGNQPHEALGTGALVPHGTGRAAFVCDLCSLSSPASSNRTLLESWAHQHAAQYHAHLTR